MNQLNEEMLKHQDEWLRRMARHLVGPAGAGDDLAQDTWVAGIEAGAARMTLRPWLFRVLSNKVSGSLSRERGADDAVRMVQREAVLEASPTDEAVADLELRERVLAELQALDEPLRTAIHQVYFLGLSTREAGEVLGVSRSTVSTRTQKGIEELRERLDRSYGGERAAWAALLVPAMGRGTAISAKVAEVQIGGWMGAMKVAGAAAMVALVVGTAWIARSPLSGPTAGPALLAGAKPPASLRMLTVPRGATSLGSVSGAVEPVGRTPVASSAQATQNATITGRFLLPGGPPAAGAKWRLRGRGANKERVQQLGLPDDWEDPEGTLDADGNLTLCFAPPQAMQFTLTVWDEGVVTERWRWGQVHPNERKELGTCLFLDACEVRGYVVDEADQPILGRSAWVYAEETAAALGGGRRVRTQMVPVDTSTGSFVLDAVPAGKVSLTVSGAVRTRSPRILNVESGSSNTARLTMDPRTHEEGHLEVRTRLGGFYFREAPVPVECVWLEGPDGLRIAAAEFRRGPRSYRFEGLPDVPLTLVAQHPAIEPVRVEQIRDAARPAIELVGRSSIRWLVTDPSGANVDQYSIEMARYGSSIRTPAPILHDGLSTLPDGRLGGLSKVHPANAIRRGWPLRVRGRRSWPVPDPRRRCAATVRVELCA